MITTSIVKRSDSVVENLNREQGLRVQASLEALCYVLDQDTISSA